MSPAEEILAHATSRPPTLGATRMVCVDGPSGSGKSTIAAEIARLAGLAGLAGLVGPAQVVHTDDLCPGWDGVPQLPGILADLLAPLTRGQVGRWPRYDWILARLVEDVVVAPAPLLVVEGVGAGARTLAALTTTLVWVDADPDLRRRRALDRDGDAFTEQWDAWARAESELFSAESARERADITVSTS